MKWGLYFAHTGRLPSHECLTENNEFAVPYVATPVATGGTTVVAGVAAHTMFQQVRQHSWNCSCGHLVDPCTHGT
jgi:hypothetical protein